MSAQVPFVEREDATEDVKTIYDMVEANFGQVLNLIKVLANSPGYLEGVMGLLGALEESELDDALRELAYLKTAQINECEY